MRNKAIDSYELNEDVVLKVEHLSIAFGGLKAIDDLSFEIKKNEIFGLIGPNGAGKTTVFNCITQFYHPNSGKVIFRARMESFKTRFLKAIYPFYKGDEYENVINLVGQKTHKIIRYGIARTFQNLELIRELSIIDNVLIGAHVQFHTGFLRHYLKTPFAIYEEHKIRQRAEEILTFLDLDVIKHHIVYGLPYGVLKKVELARALMSNPKIIILDEPAAGLNDHESERLTEIIRQIRDRFNCTIFLVEHDMKLVMDVCDHICAISFGKKLAIGTPLEIQNNTLVQEAYLGKEDD